MNFLAKLTKKWQFLAKNAFLIIKKIAVLSENSKILVKKWTFSVKNCLEKHRGNQ
jgi:hypothetical protein